MNFYYELLVVICKSCRVGSICSLFDDNIIVENFYSTVWYVNVNADIGEVENGRCQPNNSSCQQQVIAWYNLVLKRQTLVTYLLVKKRSLNFETVITSAIMSSMLLLVRLDLIDTHQPMISTALIFSRRGKWKQ